jgi:hypothetical protein
MLGRDGIRQRPSKAKSAAPSNCRIGSLVEVSENVLRAYAASLPLERLHGSLWLRQARSVARSLSVVARTTLDSAAGILSALSPLNRWEDNVSDAFRLSRNPESTVRTTHVNKWKALEILAG